METFFMNSKNSKTNEPYKFKYVLIDKLDLKNPNKNMALANLSIYYTCKNVKSTYNNNKFKISAPILSKKVLTKSAETTGDLIDNKIADRITKSATNK